MLRTALFAAGLFAASIAVAAPMIDPKCAAPAPYYSGRDCVIPVPYFYIVGVNPQLDLTTTTHDLEHLFGFKASTMDGTIPFFIAKLSPEQVAQIRCDPRVTGVNEDRAGQVTGATGS